MKVWKEGKEKWIEDVKVWEKEDTKAQGALGKVLPNSIFMEIAKYDHFHKMWKDIKNRVEKMMKH